MYRCLKAKGYSYSYDIQYVTNQPYESNFEERITEENHCMCIWLPKMNLCQKNHNIDINTTTANNINIFFNKYT